LSLAAQRVTDGDDRLVRIALLRMLDGRTTAIWSCYLTRHSVLVGLNLYAWRTGVGPRHVLVLAKQR